MSKLIQQFNCRFVQYLAWRRTLVWVILLGCSTVPALLKLEIATVWASSHVLAANDRSAIPPGPPPEPTEWIAAWISDLKQSQERWIQVDLSEQRLIAWEGETPMFSADVSTGQEGDWTPPGVYAVETKYETTSMQGEGYNIPDVPYAMYFFGSYAIHGVYWHENFGTPVSRGCVGLDVSQAAWLFSWANEGTRVVVQQ